MFTSFQVRTDKASGTVLAGRGENLSKRLALLALGQHSLSLPEVHSIMAHASLPALLGAKLHLQAGDIYAQCMLDGYISAAKRRDGV